MYVRSHFIRKKEPKSASRRLNKLKKRVLKNFLDEILNYKSGGPLSVPVPATRTGTGTGTKKFNFTETRTGTKRKILAGTEPGPKKSTGTGTKKSWSRTSLVWNKEETPTPTPFLVRSSLFVMLHIVSIYLQ